MTKISTPPRLRSRTNSPNTSCAHSSLLKSRMVMISVSAILLLSGCGGEGNSSVISTKINPLATADQQRIDAQANRIYSTYDFSIAKSIAKSKYEAAYGTTLDARERTTLDTAIDELTFASIQKEVNNDPYRPKVYALLSPPKSWLGLQLPGGRYAYDNPDAIYRWIPINGSERYVIRGHRYKNGPSDVTLSLINNVNSQGTIAYLSFSDLVIDNNGDYIVTVDSDPANGRVNHIQSTSAATRLFVRNNLTDWSTQIPDSLTVERVSTAAAPAPPTDSSIAAAAIQDLLAGGTIYGTGLLGALTLPTAVNTIPTPRVGSGLVTQANAYAHFKVETNEALVITLDPGGADYFVVPVTNEWMVSIDPGIHQSSLNNNQAVANADGTYTFVLSPSDPGVYNWLDTTGMIKGTIMLRLQRLPKSTDNIKVSTQLVKIIDLLNTLPPGTRFVTSTERQRILIARATGFAQRTITP